jgi:hypothetical protein
MKCGLCEGLLSAFVTSSMQQLQTAVYVDRAFRFDGEVDASLTANEDARKECQRALSNFHHHLEDSH